jgi:hypothetical protein
MPDDRACSEDTERSDDISCSDDIALSLYLLEAVDLILSVGYLAFLRQARDRNGFNRQAGIVGLIALQSKSAPHRVTIYFNK